MIKQDKVSVDDVYHLCNEKRWYTRGSNEEYERMFQMIRDGKPLNEVATDIYEHSEIAKCGNLKIVLDELKKISVRQKTKNRNLAR